MACAHVSIGTAQAAQPVAIAPPMGWNSWDAYGFTINEGQFKANAETLEQLKRYGWRYAVIDEGWYMRNPSGDKLETRDYQMDGHGLLIPDSQRFPSSADGQGFKPLADWIHARGLKFGLHIVRGIPKQAVENNLPIAGSDFRAQDAADKAATCGWDDGDYGVADNPAGQAYYDSMLRQYAEWGLDFLKVDCISDHPYRSSEIRQIAEAIRKSGRPIVLSLSPGPTQLSHAKEVREQAQMWRIANDLWDGWSFTHDHPEDDFPNGVRPFFDYLAAWNSWTGHGGWPDADMLPVGSLRPHPGLGEPRQSRLTADEARTLFSLWAIARSPMILGSNLTQLDADTRMLVNNAAVADLNQRAGAGRPVLAPGFDKDKLRVWVSTPGGSMRPDTVAVFNLTNEPLTVKAPWTDLGLSAGRLHLRDLWTGERLAASAEADLVVAPHGVKLLKVAQFVEARRSPARSPHKPEGR
ncbi:glycoside hydrolase family 27 protein [Phenylobacterium montanum]|uniref:Alpha-galactosidase n=1 Tax=Phenylobacterium montanum TaxID=2823693 RepID=A0A975G4F7_9CAUL|nr:glycoside hydrolase family 27 protein [Caulobacter sp. S6]